MIKKLNNAPLMIDLAAFEITPEERECLLHPLVGGVILFTRNYHDIAQLTALTASIKALPRPPLLIAVDHEGGRVQRFREGFTALPAMRVLGTLYDNDPNKALKIAADCGYVLASELRAVGVDFSFTPVLDLDYGPARVIGDRAFHRQADHVIALANALCKGLREAGMRHCGKHFPGHGYAVPDPHVAFPVDERDLLAMQEDLLPYRQLPLDAVMASHVIYSAVDETTAIFSRRWHDFLRHNLHFKGAVFTDDLSMQGASIVGDMVARVEKAHQAGCDMLLICNDPKAAIGVLDRWKMAEDAERAARIARLFPPTPFFPTREALQSHEPYLAACSALRTLSGGAP